MTAYDPTSAASLRDKLKALPQYLIPGHLISRITYGLMRIPFSFVKLPLMRWFIRHFKVNMEEVEVQRLSSFRNFNEFFTRKLAPGTRPIAEGEAAIVSPVDGTISHAGAISEGLLLQAKGHHYSLEDLLGGSGEYAHKFRNGRYITIYLSPADYHRIHMPLRGHLNTMIHVPGRLFSVNFATTKVIPGLFARNERVVSIFTTNFGPMAMVKVGAINVGSIETIWAGEVTPPAGRKVRTWHYDGHQAPWLEKGSEMGRFNMGSTVILLFPPVSLRWAEKIRPGEKIRVGELIGTISR